MKLSRHILLVVCLICLSVPISATAMTGDQILRLKQAGVSDDSIQLMIQEKSIETVSLTIEEVLDMKAAGIEEETLQAIITSSSFMNHSQNVVYELGPQGLQVSTVEDLVVLKEAGLSEETIRAIITVTSTDKNSQTYSDALRVLDNIGIWVTPNHRRPRHGDKSPRPTPYMQPE